MDGITKMRNTDYPMELVPPAVLEYRVGTNEVRLERLYVKAPVAIEIRLSWWKNGRMQLRPFGPARGKALGVARAGHQEERPRTPLQPGSARLRRYAGFFGVRHSKRSDEMTTQTL